MTDVLRVGPYRNHEIHDSIHYPDQSTPNCLQDPMGSSLVRSKPSSKPCERQPSKRARTHCYQRRIWRGSRIVWVGWRTDLSRGRGRRENKLLWRIGRKKKRPRGLKERVLSTSKRVRTHPHSPFSSFWGRGESWFWEWGCLWNSWEEEVVLESQVWWIESRQEEVG